MGFFKTSDSGLQSCKPIIEETFRFLVSSVIGGGFMKDYNDGVYNNYTYDYVRDIDLDIEVSDDLCEISIYNISCVGGSRDLCHLKNINYREDYVKFTIYKNILLDILWVYQETGLTYFAFNRRMNIYLRNRCNWLKGYIYIDLDYNFVIHKIKEKYMPKYLKNNTTFIEDICYNGVDIKNVYKFNNLREIIIKNKDKILG